ncbi:MAG TPA: META domain-containing protein [Variovorax sp.]
MRQRPAASSTLTAALLAAAFVAGCGGGISLDEPIEGPVWHLDQLAGETVPPGTDPRRDPQVQFDRSGRVVGSGGCNQLSGSFERNGSSLRLSQLASTRMACADPLRAAKEAQFFAALQSAASYRLQGSSHMALLDAGGNTIAAFSTQER